MALESILNIGEIAIAIMMRKGNVKARISKQKDDISSKIDDIDNIKSNNNDTNNKKNNDAQKSLFPGFELSEDNGYNPTKSFMEYLSSAKTKLYDYYSGAKKSIKDLVHKIGYIDKLLNEIEDWGVIFYKPTFKKLERLTPQGAVARYQQKLWLYVGKKAK